jgi:hypothetical protein
MQPLLAVESAPEPAGESTAAVAVASAAVTTPLLGDGADTAVGARRRSRRGPAAVCMALLFALKFAQQGALTALPIFAYGAYGWSPSSVGLFLGLVLGFTSVITNAAVGALSARGAADRALAAAGGAITIAGASGCVLLSPGGDWRSGAFLPGFSLIMVGTIAMEAASMSLLSKIVAAGGAASGLAGSGGVGGGARRSIWNAALLSTEAGSSGRLMGNAYIAVLGRWQRPLLGPSQLVAFARTLHAVFALGVGAALAATAARWRRLRA